MVNVVRLRAGDNRRPIIENGRVTPPKRVANRERRSREHLTPDEVDKLMAAAGRLGRHGHRDATLILLAYRHGFRVSELVTLRGPELRALRRLHRDYPASPYVFTTERRGPLTDSAVRKIVARAGEDAKLGFPVHPHMLRHACGFKL